jgi:uncharacterized protein YdaU (DUF1376 family)
MDWFPWHPTDHAADTMHLTPHEDGCYRRLIDYYMKSGQALPDNDLVLAKIIGILGEDWERVKEVVRAFFRVKGHQLHHKRCERELKVQRQFREQKVRAGKASGASRRRVTAKSLSDPDNQNEHVFNGCSTGGATQVERNRTHNRQDRTDITNITDKVVDETGGNEFAFKGQVIRLTRQQIENWRRNFHTIPDLEAELTAIDAKFTANPPKKNWFGTCAGWLRTRHERLLNEAKSSGSRPDDGWL